MTYLLYKWKMLGRLGMLFILLYFQIPVSAQLPSRIDLTMYAPTVIHQGDMPICTAVAVGYGAMTIEKAIQRNLTNSAQITKDAYSYLFIYNQIHKGRCDNGATILAAIELVKKVGNVPISLFGQKVKSCYEQPNELLKNRATKNRIKAYKLLFDKQNSILNKVNKVKSVLVQKKPVILSLQVSESFYHLKKGAKYWWPTLQDNTYAGNHALVVVGYDDSKQAFRLMNSLGREWGDHGFIWLKYKYFQQFSLEASVIYFH